MLRTQTPVRALTAADRDEALALCARNPTANVFVAARIEEGALLSMPGALLGFDTGSGLRALAWASANLVPVECDDEALDAFAYRLRRWRRQCASIFGPSHQVLGLWERLGPSWGRPRAIRHPQPLMSTTVRPHHWGGGPDLRVRLARADRVDDGLPAAGATVTSATRGPASPGPHGPSTST